MESQDFYNNSLHSYLKDFLPPPLSISPISLFLSYTLVSSFLVSSLNFLYKSSSVPSVALIHHHKIIVKSKQKSNRPDVCLCVCSSSPPERLDRFAYFYCYLCLGPGKVFIEKNSKSKKAGKPSFQGMF